MKVIIKTFVAINVICLFSCNNCEYNNGTFPATVVYYNPATDYTANYTLDVTIQDCNIVKITFPKGGRLDDTHIKPTPIINGEADVVDDHKREFNVILPEPDYEPAEAN